MAGPNTNLLPQRNDVIIAVMGMTGSGKSSFINQFQTNRPVKTGRELQSCTNRVDAYRCHDAECGTFWLIDTPGFNDTYRSDAEVLGDIANWLNKAYHEKIELTGILYVHAIRETRMSGKAINSVRSFRRLCGPEALRKVVLVSTFWDMVRPSVGRAREQELKSDPEFWGDMVAHGSSVFRHTNDLSTARAVVRHLIDIRTPDDQGTYLDIQREMMRERKTLDQTGAGRLMLDALDKQQIQFEQEMAKFRTELRDAIAQQNEEHRRRAETLHREAEANRRHVRAEKTRIDADCESLMRRIAEEDEREAAIEAQKEEEMEEEVRRIAEALRDARNQANSFQHEREQREELKALQEKLDIVKWRKRQRIQQQQGCVIF